MTAEASAASAARLRLAFDLFAFGESMMRQRLLREHPDLSVAAIEDRLLAWLATRPGAETGDADGRLVAWPRTR